MTLPARLEDFGLPGRRHELWRWTDLSAIDAALGARANDAAPDYRQWLIDGVSGPVLLFVDGRYVAAGSDPQHVTIETSGGDEAHPLSRLTRGAVGATLRLGAEHATAGPIQIIHIATGGAAQLHHCFKLGIDAQASVVETYVGAPASWTNVAATIELAANARLMRTVRRLGNGGVHTETLHASVGPSASYMSTTAMAHAESARLESDIGLPGTGAFASVDGLLLGRTRQTYDVVNRIAHAAEGGSSRQTLLVVEDGIVRTRLMSARETARLMGLPDSYRLPASYSAACHLTGDGGAAPVVRHLANGLLELLLADGPGLRSAA